MRIRRATIGASISGFLFIWSSLVCARDDEADLRSRILKEFPGALKALEEHFSRAVGSVNYSLERKMGTARPVKTVGKYTFATRWPYWARVTRVMASPPKPAKSGGPGPEGKEVPEAAASSGGEIAHCYNKDYSFNVTKKNVDSKYLIRSLDKNIDGEPLPEMKAQVNAWLYEYLHAPFSFPTVYEPWSRIISSDRFSIQRVSEVRRDGENLLKLEVRLEEGIWKIAQEKPSPEYDGWILVEPEKRWVLREYELGYDTRVGKRILRGHVEYGNIRDGFPVPTRVVTEAIDRSSMKPTYVHDFTFKDLQFVDTPDLAFTLAAFGLPELGQPGPSARRYPNRTVFWLLGAAVVSLFVAIVLKYYAGTRRRTPPEWVPGAAEHRPEGTPAN